MKKLTLILFTYILPLFLFSAEINSIEKLKAFMEEGQQKGYFPKTVLLPTFGAPKKLREVDFEFRTVIHWNSNSKCPSNEDEIILALGKVNHSIVCNAGDTAGILGAGDDWVDDATGNDIYYPGKGNDTVDTGSGNDILIFDDNWGQDKITVRSRKVNTDTIMGYDGSYPWKYNTFIIFGKEVKREDIVWRENKLYHLVTGDSIALNTKEINVLFASDPENNTMPVPTQEFIDLEELKSESVLADSKYLYLAKGNEGMHIVNMEDPSHPIVISKLVLPGRTMDIVIENNIAYVAQGDYYLSGKMGWVSIVDIKDKTAPKLLKTLKFGNAIRSVEVHDSKLYISDTHFSEGSRRKLHIYDVKEAEQPLLLFQSKVKFRMRNMVALDNKLYFLSTHDKIKVFDISDPTSPQLMKDSLLYGQNAYSIAVKGNLLVHTYAEHGIKMYRMKSDHHLHQICDLTTMEPKIPKYGKKNTLIIGDGLVYKAENTEGISVSSINECRVMNTIRSSTKRWTSMIIKVDNRLINFSPLDRGWTYLLKDDMIHEKKKVQNVSEKSPKTSVQTKLSLDQLQTLLYEASIKNNRFEVRRVCALGANPNVSGHERYTPVEIAARTGKNDALKALLLDCEGKATKTSMFLAALTEQNEAMKILEKYGVPVTVINKRGCTTLHSIAQDGSLDMVKYLIEKGVPYNAKCKNGETPLKWANYGTNCSVIEYLENLYSSEYKKIGNEKCRKKKLKEKLVKINNKIRKLERKINRPPYWEAKSIGMRIKAKQKEDLLAVKFQFTHPMVAPWQAKKKRINVDYIDHVTLKVGDRIVFDMSNNFNVSTNPIIKLKVKNCETNKKLKLLLHANHGITKSISTDIRVSSQRMPDNCTFEKGEVRDFKKSHPGFWKAKTVTDASSKLYGDMTYIEGDFEIIMPKLAAYSGSIPIEINSDLDLESMAILTNANPYSAVAVFSVPEGTKVNYALRIKGKKPGEYYVVIIAKGRDGKFYKCIKTFIIAGNQCS